MLAQFRRGVDSFSFLSDCAFHLKAILRQDTDFVQQLLELDDWIEEG